jgi:eukaryotic-like serine/threonine-protein kinase
VTDVVRTDTVLMGKWRIVRELAHGGTSTVYEAVHRNGRRAAVKLLRPSLAADQRGRARFLRESALANKVNHPGVISVIDEDVTPEGLVFLVMELLAGETLEQRWARCGKRLPVADAIAIVVEILQPLVAVHGVGIIHRDLKPSNVFLSTHGIKLLDFGVARLREINADEGAITRSGAMLGTPAFMAPEQARGHWHDIDARTDIWAVGAILFVLLSGRHVHEGQTPNELLIASATQPAESLARFAPDVPAELVALVDRALSRDKELRWPDAASMLAALRAIQETVPGSAQPFSAAVGNDGTPSITTLPEESSLQLAARTRAGRSRGRRTSALLLGGVGIAALILATVVTSRTAMISSPAPSNANAAMAHTLQAAMARDEASGVAPRADISNAPAPSSLAGPEPVPAVRARRARPKNAAPSRTQVAEAAVASDAASDEAPKPSQPPAAHQTFSGIVVDDDALDERR